MINPNSSIIKPIGAINSQASQNVPVMPKQSSAALADNINNVISNNINKDIELSQMDLFGKNKVKGLGKKDKAPKVGIIETPPYDKTPIEHELNRLKIQNPKEKREKLPNKNLDLSGILMLGTIAIGAFILLSQIKKPIASIIKKIFKK